MLCSRCGADAHDGRVYDTDLLCQPCLSDALATDHVVEAPVVTERPAA